MIKGKIKYKRPKLTLDQKAMKKAIRPIAKEIKGQVKAEVPKRSGALKFAIDYKIISRKGSSAAVIGVRSKYSRVVKGRERIPNKYALRVGAKEVIARHVNQTTVERLREAAAQVVSEMLKKAK